MLLFDPYWGVESRSGGLDAQRFPATAPRKNVRILFHVQTVFKQQTKTDSRHLLNTRMTTLVRGSTAPDHEWLQVLSFETYSM